MGDGIPEVLSSEEWWDNRGWGHKEYRRRFHNRPCWSLRNECGKHRRWLDWIYIESKLCHIHWEHSCQTHVLPYVITNETTCECKQDKIDTIRSPSRSSCGCEEITWIQSRRHRWLPLNSRNRDSCGYKNMSSLSQETWVRCASTPGVVKLVKKPSETRVKTKTWVVDGKEQEVWDVQVDTWKVQALLLAKKSVRSRVLKPQYMVQLSSKVLRELRMSGGLVRKIISLGWKKPPGNRMWEVVCIARDYDALVDTSRAEDVQSPQRSAQEHKHLELRYDIWIVASGEMRRLSEEEESTWPREKPQW